MKVRCVFHGRKSGALGVSGFQCIDLDVPDPIDWHALNLKLYDTHEHISGLRVIDRDTNKEIKP